MNFNFKQEFNRKLIHLSSSIYPILYMFFTKEVMVVITSVVLASVFLWDFCRLIKIELQFLSFINKFIREKESKRLIGATYFLASILLVIILFPKNIAIVSMFILIFCDTFAALIGKSIGKLKIKSLDKSIEGFIAFIITGFFILCIYLQIVYETVTYNLYLLSFISICITGMVELFSNKVKIDDNFSITLVSALCLYFFL